MTRKFLHVGHNIYKITSFPYDNRWILCLKHLPLQVCRAGLANARKIWLTRHGRSEHGWITLHK